MGYDVQIVKPDEPFSDGERLSDDEWRGFQDEHADIDYVYFSNGRITCKNPSELQVATLAKLAFAKGWRLRGDDGEYYDEHGQAIQEPAPRRGFFSRLKDAFTRRHSTKELNILATGVTPVFKVGDPVKFLDRRGGVVIEVDSSGFSGMGSIRARFPDGTILGGPFPDGGFERDL
ncbi:MAG TPA: hypothetical protein VJ691_00345 [Vicinamibacterales bacterium]|nr:hypothetical protein [Vicinamibacterales bacterium]